MPQVSGRYIDKSGWHVVIVRKGDVIVHHRFSKLADADAFADDTETVVGRPAGLGLATYNRPWQEWT